MQTLFPSHCKRRTGQRLSGRASARHGHDSAIAVASGRPETSGCGLRVASLKHVHRCRCPQRLVDLFRIQHDDRVDILTGDVNLSPAGAEVQEEVGISRSTLTSLFGMMPLLLIVDGYIR